MAILPAMLLLGPTGSGKTPLGDALEHKGLERKKLAHFDFGSELRSAAASPERYPSLGREDIAVIGRVLAEGALLTDDEFPIAAGLFRSFMKRVPEDAAAVILNGLPRHAGQAAAVAELVNITCVVVLACSSDTVRMRIARNSGGDRSGRVDDAPQDITRKLEIFRERTEPLIAHYRQRGASLISIDIGVDTLPSHIIAILEKRILW